MAVVSKEKLQLAKARLTARQAYRIKILNAVTKGDLVDLEKQVAEWSLALARFRSQLESLPARVSRELTDLHLTPAQLASLREWVGLVLSAAADPMQLTAGWHPGDDDVSGQSHKKTSLAHKGAGR